ncbi:hypothetical protein SBRCBS47491_001591 [Sporothrix bragantina]|uniref:Uncharacterized protein n=1 Tax=Sporothrix bragantina TaxID=671064 RepID=A0ABP0B0H7_9PEZI
MGNNSKEVKLGKISSHCGIPLFSAHGREWIKAQAGEDVGSQILSLVEAPRSGGSLTPSLLAGYALAGSSLDLPPRPVVESCLNAFRLSPFRLVFPVVDHVLFPETIDAAYVQNVSGTMVPSMEQLAAKASIFAFLSVLAAAGAEFREMLPEIDELINRHVMREDTGGSIEHDMLSKPYDGAAEAPWLPGDLRLSVMKSKTYRMLFSTEALRKPDAELLRDIRELDEELERWRMSLPAETRPQLFYARAKVPSLHAFGGRLSQGQMMHRTVLHFEYHYLLATIHRAVGRCRAWGSDGGTSDEISMLQSSLTLSVEASRETIFYLRLAMDTLFENCFWYVD